MQSRNNSRRADDFSKFREIEIIPYFGVLVTRVEVTRRADGVPTISVANPKDF